MNIIHGIKKIFARIAHTNDEFRIARHEYDIECTRDSFASSRRSSQDEIKAYLASVKFKQACLTRVRSQYQERAQKYGFKTKPTETSALPKRRPTLT